MMMETLKEITRKALVDTNTARIPWIRKYPGQIVLGVNMARWTQGAEIAITKGKDKNIGSSPHYSDLKTFR